MAAYQRQFSAHNGPFVVQLTVFLCRQSSSSKASSLSASGLTVSVSFDGLNWNHKWQEVTLRTNVAPFNIAWQSRNWIKWIKIGHGSLLLECCQRSFAYTLGFMNLALCVKVTKRKWRCWCTSLYLVACFRLWSGRWRSCVWSNTQISSRLPTAAETNENYQQQ